MKTASDTTASKVHPLIERLINASSMEGVSDAEREIRQERSAAAAGSFRQLLTGAQRNMLLSAASRSNMLFLTLASGDWESAVRALRGYVARAIPREDWNEYRELIVALNVLTPHALELTGHRHVVDDDESVLVAA